MSIRLGGVSANSLAAMLIRCGHYGEDNKKLRWEYHSGTYPLDIYREVLDISRGASHPIVPCPPTLTLKLFLLDCSDV